MAAMKTQGPIAGHEIVHGEGDAERDAAGDGQAAFGAVPPRPRGRRMIVAVQARDFLVLAVLVWRSA